MLFSIVCAGVFGSAALLAAAGDTVAFSMKRRQLTKSQSSLLRPLHFTDHWVPPGGYFIDIEIGTPPQHFEVILDTGSSNLFVASAAAQPCLDYRCPGGSFDDSASSTFALVQEPMIFNISYLDGSRVIGNYTSDLVSIGDATLNFTFGLANEIQVSPNQGPDAAQYGIMGFSFDTEETGSCYHGITENASVCDVSFTIPTIPDALYEAGYIQSRSYSLYLDSLEEQSGSILFGGIDTAKFTGDLVTLATQVDLSGDVQNGTYVSQDVRLTSISATINSTSTQLSQSNFSATVTIDSGTAGFTLPDPFFSAIMSGLPILTDANGNNVIPCSYASTNAYLTAEFTGADGTSVSIDLPLSQFIFTEWDFSQGGYNSTTTSELEGEEVCVFALYYSEVSDGLLLGDPLFRSAYIVFDLDHKTISFAQASYNSTSSNIVPIGSDGVPQLTGTGGSTSSGTTNSTQPGTGEPASPTSNAYSFLPTCSPDGALICNGETQFGLCNFGHVLFQHVADGTACVNGAITWD